MVCPVSNEIGDKSYQYLQTIGDRTAVLYRGNDKVKEIPITPYSAMVEMALQSGADKFFVQTDEQEFFNHFKATFPDTIRIDELPMIHKNPNSYVMPNKKDSKQFLVNFIAVLRAMGNAKQFITTTGNTGLWAMFFRGHTREVWQYNGKHGIHKKLSV